MAPLIQPVVDLLSLTCAAGAIVAVALIVPFLLARQLRWIGYNLEDPDYFDRGH